MSGGCGGCSARGRSGQGCSKAVATVDCAFSHLSSIAGDRKEWHRLCDCTDVKALRTAPVSSQVKVDVVDEVVQEVVVEIEGWVVVNEGEGQELKCGNSECQKKYRYHGPCRRSEARNSLMKSWTNCCATRGCGCRL
eukprot:960900-Amphidinium_carterae.2